MTTPLEPIHDDDNVTLEFTVTKTDGTAQPITDATITATAKSKSSGDVVALTSAITGGAGGVFTVAITPGNLTSGVWTVQAKVELTTGEIQTPLDRSVFVKPSH